MIATPEYRYTLARTWRPTAPRLLWVMLNPSTADAEQDDATIRRCVRFSAGFKYGGLDVVNLLAARATKPDDLEAFNDPSGPDNDRATIDALSTHRHVIAAWGATRPPHVAALIAERVAFVLDAALLAGCRVFALGTTKEGHPRHPLYLKSDAPPTLWP